MSNRDHGEIIFWSGNAGYGFIRPDAGDRDVFFHLSGCKLPKGETPRLRDRVSYTVGTDERKGRPIAQDVRYENEDKNEVAAAPGMFEGTNLANSNARGALAEGLKKFLNQ